MALKASDIVDTICAKIGIEREKAGDQFLTKQELLMILAYIDKMEIHIRSLKKEVDESRELRARINTYMLLQMEKDATETGVEGVPANA